MLPFGKFNTSNISPSYSTFSRSRKLFLKGICLVYFLAIISWYVQFDALYSTNFGILPLKRVVERQYEGMIDLDWDWDLSFF